MASHERAGTPDERQRNLASLNLRELAGELSLLAHATATGEHYDADRLNALTDALRTIGRGGGVVRRAICGGLSQALLYDATLGLRSLGPGQATKLLLHRLRLSTRKWKFVLRDHHAPNHRYPSRWPPIRGDTSACIQRHEPAAASDATYRA
eukprot:6213893-Pleurochrysis_carterae.AAC.2